jgi:hypothetical protein
VAARGTPAGPSNQGVIKGTVGRRRDGQSVLWLKRALAEDPFVHFYVASTLFILSNRKKTNLINF